VEIRVTLEDDRLIWRGTISSQETDPAIEVTELWIPWIRNIGDMGLGRDADVLYWPERAGRRMRNPYEGIMRASQRGDAAGRRSEPELRLTYPWPASMQWYTFNNGEEGLYFASHDRTLMTSCLNVMRKGNRNSLHPL
jgi:hypothetical protein